MATKSPRAANWVLFLNGSFRSSKQIISRMPAPLSDPVVSEWVKHASVVHEDMKLSQLTLKLQLAKTPSCLALSVGSDGPINVILCQTWRDGVPQQIQSTRVLCQLYVSLIATFTTPIIFGQTLDVFSIASNEKGDPMGRPDIQYN